jgi:cation-transporting ATPase E
LIPFVEPPTEAWVAGDAFSGDWRPTILPLGLLGVYAVVLAVPPLRTSFELTSLWIVDYAVIGAAVVVWAVLLRFAWRSGLFERVVARDRSLLIYDKWGRPVVLRHPIPVRSIA